jgi:hypothetical protein
MLARLMEATGPGRTGKSNYLPNVRVNVKTNPQGAALLSNLVVFVKFMGRM